MPTDPFLDAAEPARHLAGELALAIERVIERRRAAWPALLVAAPLDDAMRLHQALAASLGRLCATLSPELLQAVGLVEPPRPASPARPAEHGEWSALQ